MSRKETTYLSIGIFITLLLYGFTLYQYEEYSVKAVFIERFTRFIEWPEESEIDNISKPFIITVIGDSPISNILKKVYSTERIRHKSVKIQTIKKIEDINDTHILYISDINPDELPDIISYTKNKPILTISETEGFAEMGTHINFIVLEQNIKFEINDKAMHNSGLKVSHLLLGSAKVINPIK